MGEVKRSPLPRIERVAQAVADEVERQHHEEDRQSRPQRHPRRVGQEALRGVQEYAELIYGLILLGTLLFLPKGLVGLVARLELLRPAKPLTEPPAKPPVKEPAYGAS